MWVFGYGSLMWDGWEVPLHGSRVDGARLKHYRRSFNKSSTRNWGTRRHPAPTLGLEPDEGAECVGSAFEFPEEERGRIERFLIDREGRAFTLPELPVRLPDGREVNALVPVNDRSGSTYLGNVAPVTRAAMARNAHGSSGNCTEYVRNIHNRLNSLGIIDAAVEEFVRFIGQ